MENYVSKLERLKKVGGTSAQVREQLELCNSELQNILVRQICWYIHYILHEDWSPRNRLDFEKKFGWMACEVHKRLLLGTKTTQIFAMLSAQISSLFHRLWRENWRTKLPVCRRKWEGSGCGAVGRAVTYDTRGPGFESSHRQLLFEHLFTVNCL